MNHELQKRLFYINKGDCRRFPFKLLCKDCMFMLKCKDKDFAEDEIYQEVKKMLDLSKKNKDNTEGDKNAYKLRRRIEKKGNFILPVFFKQSSYNKKYDQY